MSRRWGRYLAVVVLLCMAALPSGCGGGEEDVGSGWEGDREEREGVLVVRTLSGSVWGGRAVLGEIGTLEDDPSDPVLVDVRGFASAEGRTYVLDIRAPGVHVFDGQGRFLQTIGREGDGPGEFRRPISLSLDEEGDRLFMRDARLRRVSVFDLQGTYRDTWSTPASRGLTRPDICTEDGVLYVPVVLNPADAPADWRQGMAACGPAAAARDTLIPPGIPCQALELEFAGTTRGSITIPLPFGPRMV